MPPKRKKVAKVYIQNQDGTGFWGDVWGGIKKGVNFVPDLAKKGLDIARRTGAVSKGLDLIGRSDLATGARMVGLGRKRKTRRSQRGGASGIVRF